MEMLNGKIIGESGENMEKHDNGGLLLENHRSLKEIDEIGDLSSLTTSCVDQIMGFLW